MKGRIIEGTEVADPSERERLIGLAEDEGAETDDTTRVIRHPVIPDFFLIYTDTGDMFPSAYIVKRDEVWSAADTFAEPTFLEVELGVDDSGRLAFGYPDEDDEGPIFTPYEDGYVSQWKEGDIVYPCYFHPNVPGGWTVWKDGREEYWQC